jgi:hypothetical protein
MIKQGRLDGGDLQYAWERREMHTTFQQDKFEGRRGWRYLVTDGRTLLK